MLISMHYLHRDRKTNNFIYRRSVPEHLRRTIDRREINKSLGTKDQTEAIQRYQTVHGEVESLFHAARRQNSPSEVYRVAAEYLRSNGFNPDVALNDPQLSKLEHFKRVEFLEDVIERDIRGEDGDPDADYVRDPADQPKVDLLIHGREGVQATPTLAEALEMFIIERGRDKVKYRRDQRWRDFHRRAVHLLGTVLHDGVHTGLDKITRQDAIRWRDMMVAEYAQETVKKHHVTLKTVFKLMLDVLELNKRNPFDNLTVKFDRKQSSRDRRHALSEAKEALLRSAIPRMNREAQLVVHLMLCTGCRVVEACALDEKDICLDGDIPYITIQENEGNEWHIKGSFIRRVPVVSSEALALLREFPAGPSRYKKPGGAASCSSAINKLLRKHGLKEGDAKVSLYSARHTLRTRLLSVQAPEYVIDEIMGHSDGKAKEAYGDGVPVAVTSEWLRKAFDK